VSAVSEILHDYQHVISDLLVVTSQGGTFDVEVDGTLIYSKALTGRHANSGEVLGLFRDFVGSETPVYER
jgi:selenoprotein W-related protein